MKAVLCVLAVLAVGSISWAHCGSCDEKGEKRHHKKGGYFKKMDTDGDGKVSKSEFGAAHDARFAKMDTNGDGFITKEEKKAHRKSKKHSH